MQKALQENLLAMWLKRKSLIVIPLKVVLQYLDNGFEDEESPVADFRRLKSEEMKKQV